jgi:predicted acylesterase/phospholipase RssA
MTEEEPESRVISSTEDMPCETIGIALSGGGSRAALYSLGVLLYLVHSNLNSRVRLISSVSGGSIVNAVLSLTKDYSRQSSQEFEKIAGRLASRLATKGVFFFPGWGKVTLPALIAIVVFFPLTITRDLFSGRGLQYGLKDYGKFMLSFGLLYIAVLLLSRTLYTWFGRRRAQISIYASLISGFQDKDNIFSSNQDIRLTEVNEETRVRHVLCATELTSGRPIYIDRREIRSPAYGSGESNLSLAKAVYASAAFPVGFPPLRIKASSLYMAGGDTEEKPKWLLLSDGGVFNNLGTDSFTAWTASDPFMPDARFADWPWPEISRRIVVNASSPGRMGRIPPFWLWRNVAIIQRIMAVLYENTLRPRIQALLLEEERLNDPLVIDIANSPIAILERQIEIQGSTGSDEYKRARDALDKLRKFQNTAYWHEYSVRASTTKTVLRAIGSTAAVRLLRLGYLDATVTCHVLLNSADLDKVPSEAWFQDLVRDRDGSQKALWISMYEKARRALRKIN